MGMSAFYETAEESDAIATIHRALALGVTLLDTAEIYGPFIGEMARFEAYTDDELRLIEQFMRVASQTLDQHAGRIEQLRRAKGGGAGRPPPGDDRR